MTQNRLRDAIRLALLACLALMAACKKAAPVPDVCDGTNVNGFCCQVKLVNKTTGETLNPESFTAEANDHLEMELRVTGEDPDVYLSSVDVLADRGAGDWGFVFLHYDCDPSGERIPNPAGIDCFDRILKTNLYCVTQREEWGFRVPQDIDAPVFIEIYSVDSQGTAIGLDRQMIGMARFTAEQDYLNIPDSYAITKNKIPELAEILSDSSVINANGKQYGYDRILLALSNLCDGKEEPGNFEASYVNIYDIKGYTGSYNAGSISFMRADVFADTFFTNSETTMLHLRQLYGLP